MLPGLPRAAICAGHRVGGRHTTEPSPSESEGRPDHSRRSPGRAAQLGGDKGSACGIGSISSKNASSGLIARTLFWPAGSFRTAL